MTKIRKTLAAQVALAAGALALGSAPLVASAGVLGDMTQMFMSNSTAAGTLSTRDRVGAFGGSFEMRAPVTNVNLVSFDRPRFDAGCGGVDLYGGSFSFINSQQLIQVFRAVAANAVGLAFKAAIKAISPSLDSLLTEFQTLLQNMNNLGKNSCMMAHAIVDPAESALASALNADGPAGTVQSNMFTDAMGSLQGYLADANGFFKKQASMNPKSGNGNMKAIMASGVSATMGLAGIANYDGSTDDATNPNSLNNRLLVSLMGYETDAVPCTNQAADGTPDTTQAANPGNPATPLPNLTCVGAATIKLTDLINGGGIGSMAPAKPLQLYFCTDMNGTVYPGAVDPQICTKMQAQDYDYPGIRAFINIAMFGTIDPMGPIAPTSILGKYTNGQGMSVQLTSQQWQLLHTTGIPLPALFGKSSNPLTRLAIAQRLDDHIVACVAAAVGEAIYKGANGVQTGGESTLGADAMKNIEALRHDYLQQLDVCLNDNKVLNVVHELNESARMVGRSIK